MSSYSDWLAAGETPYHINLSELALSDEKPIILFQFNPNEEQEFARYLGNIIMSDLSRASAEKEKRGNKSLFGLYIDECQVLDPNKIATLVEKVRSASSLQQSQLNHQHRFQRQLHRTQKILY